MTEEIKEEKKKEKKEGPEKEQKQREEKEEVKVPKKFEKLVKEIENLSVLDLAELVKVLEKKFGVSATPQVVTASASETGQGEEGTGVEKSVFNIELTGIGDKKIEVIKAVRDITQKGLKDAKDLVDAVEKSPQVIKENVKKEEAEQIKKKLETAGAKVELK